jgi:KDO2-lipid IV(A) lauroyltransferase
MINKALSSVGVFFLYLLSLLPFWFLYLLADVLFFALYHITKYRRKVVQENLANAFPEKTIAERSAIEKKYYRYLADLIIEIVKLFSISEKELYKRLQPHNVEYLEAAFANGKSVLGAVAHYGNWEMAGLRMSLLTTNRRVVVYKPLSNAIFDGAFEKMRSRLGATLVSMKMTMRKMVEFRKELTFTVLVSDQTPVKSEIKYFAPFLNQPTPVFLGVERMAKMIDCVVVFCDIRRIKRGYYTCTLVPLFEDPKNTAEYEITDAHVAYLEKVIKEEPQYWLWSHRRWKYKPGDIS